VGVLLLTLTRE
jgi:ribonuclease HI